MQTLGLSDSTPRSEGWTKSLFWPQIENGSDVDYLGSQGFWLCMLLASGSLILATWTGELLAGVLVFIVFFFGAIGIWERSRYAAVIVFATYLLESAGGISLLRIFFLALLLSNVRATWMAARWKPDSEEAFLPPRSDENLRDKFADKMPPWIWPKVRYPYYVFTVILFHFVLLGVVAMITERNVD